MKILDHVREAWKFRLVGYAIMPEHACYLRRLQVQPAPVLISEPEKGNPSRVPQVLKQTTSRALRSKRKRAAGQLSLAFSDVLEEESRFWQRRFYNFNVWSGKKLREKLEYMHMNPVKRKLVLHPKDWPWSSWWCYEKGEGGLIEMDSVNESD